MSRFKFALAICAVLIFPGAAQTPPAKQDVEKRVDSILGKMTLEEKIDILGGVNDFFIRSIPRLGLPPLKMADGPLSVRNFGPSTAFAAGIALTASWDPDLANRIGMALGKEARAKGVHFLLGPAVNIHRAPMCGRNFEYFGEDPFLASRIAVGYIKGVQSQGVIATIKHFMGNNQEYDRHDMSSDIDQRTMREIYLPTFEAAVKEARVGAVMNSYNLVNGVHMTQNDFLNNQVLKREWGFAGILMSDWTSTYDAVAAANGGLDLEMPSARFMNREKLLPAIQQGKVATATIDDKVRRILRKAVEFGFLDREQTDLGYPRYDQYGHQLALEAARSSIVLLKNDGKLLPLDKQKIKSLAVIGPNAHPANPVGGGSARVEPFASISFLEGISNYLGTGAMVYYNRGLRDLNTIYDNTAFVTEVNGRPGLKAEYFDNTELKGAPTRVDNHVHFQSSNSTFDPTPFSVRWSGYYVPKVSGQHYFYVSAAGRDSYKLQVNDEIVLNQTSHEGQVPAAHAMQLQAGVPYQVVLEYTKRSNSRYTGYGFGVASFDDLVTSEAKQMAKMADAAIVFVGFEPVSEAEGTDRTFTLPAGQDQLIKTISSLNRKTAVVITAGGNVDMQQWLASVPALLHAWYPGQEGGTALAQLFFGDFNPSGKLPATFERRWEDSAVHDNYYPAHPGDKNVVYKEGVFLGYRHFDKDNIQPQFPFGYGLSYTTFALANLRLSPQTPKTGDTVSASFDVTNTGTRTGAEVAQVYVGQASPSVPRPLKELKGFAKVLLKPGETRQVSVSLDARAMSYYDVNKNRWMAEPGKYTVLVGESSRDIKLQADFQLQAR